MPNDCSGSEKGSIGDSDIGSEDHVRFTTNREHVADLLEPCLRNCAWTAEV